MNIARRRLTVPLAIVVAAATLPLLTGCFGNPVQGLVKAATGGKVNVGGGGSLPSDFPSSIKVYSGKVDEGIGLGSGKKEVWNVTVEIPNQDATKDIVSELKASGFKVQTAATGSTGTAIEATSSTYTVLVGVTEADKKWVANYTVGPADDSSN